MRDPTITGKIGGLLKWTASGVKNIWNAGKFVAGVTLGDIEGQGKLGIDINKNNTTKLANSSLQIVKDTAEAIADEKSLWDKRIEAVKNATVAAGEDIGSKIKNLKKQARDVIAARAAEGKKAWEQWVKENQEALEEEKRKLEVEKAAKQKSDASK